MPSKHQPRLTADDIDMHLNAAATTAPHPQPQQRSNLLVVMVAFQTGILLAMAVVGVYAYDQVMTEAAKLQKVNAFINDPALVFEANPQLSTSVNAFLRETAGVFFLGSPNGTISAFVEDIFESDFASVANALRPLASVVAHKFTAKQAEPQCTQLVQCENYGPLYCPDNGPTRYCNGTGSVVNCASCPFGDIVEITTIVDSVLSRVSELQTIAPVAGDHPPGAFSAGLLRLNSLISWVGSQGDVGSWANAAKACDELANSLSAINWSGNYTSHHGTSKSWHANSEISSVVTQARLYCPVIASIGAMSNAAASPTSAAHRLRKHAP